MKKVIDDGDDQRIYRAKTQKIYLVNRNVTDKSADFDIMGSTGNIYTVSLNGKPECTCPDHELRNRRCKHILFMLAKIFNVEDPYQPKFSMNEIKKYITCYQENIKKFNISYDTKNKCIDVGKRDICDDCIICLDPIDNGEKYIYCKTSCGKCLHENCYNMFRKTGKTTCPYCMNEFKFNN